ncbi:DUF2568 domain-containing protein [Micropruina sp.]|uniref:DUF2568 domain-containing protein n=1 Tax=Micropruina sp. TaxID=2737536 RepID=UPI0039E53C7A
MSETGPLEGASPTLTAALTLRFLLELALLAGVGLLAWSLARGWWSWPAAILAVVAVAVVWGLFLSPKATVPLAPAAVLAIEAVLFVGTGAGLVTVGWGIAAAIGVAIWAADRIALALLRR